MICYMALSWHWIQDSHICIETRLQSGLPGNFDWVSPRDNTFVFSPNYSDRLWTPSSLSVDTSCTLLGDKNWWRWPYILMPRFRVCGAIPPPSTNIHGIVLN